VQLRSLSDRIQGTRGYTIEMVLTPTSTASDDVGLQAAAGGIPVRRAARLTADGRFKKAQKILTHLESERDAFRRRADRSD